MAIRYKVQKQIFQGQDMFVGRVELKGSYDRDMLIKRMLEMGSTITQADIVAVITNFEKAVKNICLEGNKITMDGFMQFTPVLAGKFESELDGFDGVRHDVYVTAQISTAFNNEFELAASMEKVSSTERRPSIIGVKDTQTGEINKGITKLNMVSLNGENLKFDTVAADEYLRFVNSADPSTFVKIDKFQKITDKEIVILVPDITFANGYFELASKLNTLTLRVGRNNSILTVH